MADNHSDTIWAQGWMSVVRPMSRLGTLAFKVPIKVPALGTVPECEVDNTGSSPLRMR